jgi:DNA-binding Lrp family transcriptional regulator
MEDLTDSARSLVACGSELHDGSKERRFPWRRCQAVQAYELIQAEVGRAASVGAELAKIAGVISAEVVTGPYDVIALVEADTIDSLGKLVVARIQAVEGITRTLTCPIIRI